jgi:hypothetical protein
VFWEHRFQSDAIFADQDLRDHGRKQVQLVKDIHHVFEPVWLIEGEWEEEDSPGIESV